MDAVSVRGVSVYTRVRACCQNGMSTARYCVGKRGAQLTARQGT